MKIIYVEHTVWYKRLWHWAIRSCNGSRKKPYHTLKRALKDVPKKADGNFQIEIL